MDRFQAGDRGGEDCTNVADASLMRRLSARYAPTGTAKLGLRGPARRSMAALLDRVARLRRTQEGTSTPLGLLDGQAPVLEALFLRAAQEGGARLPAWDGRPRIEAALAALCAGDEALTRPRLLNAVAELDAAQTLTQAELWAVPEALRVALCHGLLRVAEDIVRRAAQRDRACRWVRRASRRPGNIDAAFLGQALKCAEAEGLGEVRQRLEDRLLRRGLTPRAAVARDQADEAAAQLRLENLLAARRMLDGLDWQRCFCQLSRVEAELYHDAAGTYPRMDEPSRAAVRKQVAAIAARLKLPEPAVARAAVDAAREGKGLRREVCWWLYDDEGRQALLTRLGRGRCRLQKLSPDSSGRGTVAVLLALAAAFMVLLAICADTPWLWLPCAILGWCAADQLVARLWAGLFHPARLLKLDMQAVPDACRTLVTMPVLLSSPRRVRDICDQLEALGCLETDDNIEYLLLGDFADAPQCHMPGDGPILDVARQCIEAMNARAGRRKYALLCRDRAYLEADGVWMGRDRKRGALMDLNRLLLGAEGSEAAFFAEGADCGRLKGRFAFVITLDADTRALPGDLRRLIGAMAHPLNRPGEGRGYAVLQPRMETPPSACVNGFVSLFAGAGGLSAYPIDVSNLWQDATGRGIYGGKGIYDVAAFQARVDGLLPHGRVLSHDLVEGALASAGFVGDVALYEGYPTALRACLDRQHRWMRGDWQLLPLLFHLGRRIGAADRFRMVDNLVRSLRAPALLALLLGGAWLGRAWALGAALALAWLEPLLHLGNGDVMKWRRATAELAILPLSAACALDAAGRTLWRLAVSGRGLMQWVTAADAESTAHRRRTPRGPGRITALLLAPGLAGGECALAVMAVMALFLLGPGWVRDMERETVCRAEPLTEAQRDVFLSLARRTWRFFEDNMAPKDSPLPPDNVQLDPPMGAARRTSPSNIALYLLSCLSALRLGFIEADELHRRVGALLDALERMEKWRGQLYNWYDIDTLEPLRPRYVSSVDSGNLAAALLTCANARELGPALASRLRALAGGMDLAALYDGEQQLFAIGIDVESGRISGAHYDLLASESRILSFTAMMLGQAPVVHWRRLGRHCVGVGGGVAPLSWSGTLFEYLMPGLFMAAPPQTLLGEGVRAAVQAQIDQGRRLKRPWGVSESSYCALDAGMNYQYRAFGLRALALDGEAVEGVVAPYATALAAMVVPGEAADNGADATAGLVRAMVALRGGGLPAPGGGRRAGRCRQPHGPPSGHGPVCPVQRPHRQFPSGGLHGSAPGPRAVAAAGGAGLRCRTPAAGAALEPQAGGAPGPVRPMGRPIGADAPDALASWGGV